jgi:hypothetical protein
MNLIGPARKAEEMCVVDAVTGHVGERGREHDLSRSVKGLACRKMSRETLMTNGTREIRV